MRRSIFPFLITLLSAAGLWLAVNLAGDVQTNIRLPLSVDVPEGLASSSPLPRTLRATVRGPGWKVVQFALLADPVCRVDLNEGTPARTAMTITRRAMLQSITLPSQLSLTDLEPDSIPITLEPRRERTVPVEPALSVQCRHGFKQSGLARAEPDSVRISGAASVVERVTSWSTRPASIVNAVGPVHLELPLSDSLAELVTLPQQKILVTADVQETAERTFTRIPVHVLNAPSDVRVRLVPQTISVLVRGGAETLALLNAVDLHATVDYFELAESAGGRAFVKISAPSHVSVLQLVPHTVTWFTRRQP